MRTPVEGLASFKPKGVRSSHRNDVIKLRTVIWDRGSTFGVVVPAEKLAVSPKHELRSAFVVAATSSRN